MAAADLALQDQHLKSQVYLPVPADSTYEGNLKIHQMT